MGLIEFWKSGCRSMLLLRLRNLYRLSMAWPFQRRSSLRTHYVLLWNQSADLRNFRLLIHF